MTYLEGPVDLVDGALVLRIPLDEGGAAFVDCAKGIGRIEGEDLVITIPGWLAEKLGIAAGSSVQIDNAGGRFNFRPSPTA